MSASVPGPELSESEDRAALRKLARDVAERDIAPHAAGWDETEEFAEASLQALRRADLFTVTVAEEFGGMGMGDVEAAIVLEELARVDVSSAILCQLVFNGPPRAIEHLGHDAMRRAWLPQAAAGELFCIGITEPDAGSAATSMRAHLVPDGDGWRLEAYKNYVTGGHRAVACLVWCRFPGSEAGTGKGIGAVLVDLAADGVSVAGTHRKMGLRGCTEAELAFDGVRVAPEDVLVPGDPADNSGLKTLLAHINHERCGNAAMCLGAAQGALEYAISYMNDRAVGTRKLADLQGLQWKIADMAVELEGARLLLDRALVAAGPGGTPPALESAMAKIACNLAAKKVCDEAIQLLGGYGYSREYPVERAYRDIRGLCIGAGTVEIQRNFVGTSLLTGRVPGRPLVEDAPPVTTRTDPGVGAVGAVTPVAVLAVGTAAPSLRLAAADVAGAWGSGGGRGIVGVCDADEDTLTLAWQAAVRALAAARMEAAALSGLWWGTTRPPFAEGPSHAFLSTALGLDPSASGALCSGSPHAGMEALLAAWDALAAGHARVALVVASDSLVPGVGTAGESTTGAGAVAYVLGPLDHGASGGNGSGPPARLVGRATSVLAAVDRYRGDAERATGDVYDGRLFREEVFVPLLTAVGGSLGAGAGAGARAGAAAPVTAGWAIADPDGKLAPAVAKRLGGPLLSAPVVAALGDTGAAAALLGAAAGWAETEAPAVLGMIAYGGGRATAVTVELTRPVPGADEVGAVVGGGRRVGYVEAIRARGQLEPMSDPIPMGVPPAGAAFVRGNVEMLALEGAKCRICGTISTPPSIHPRCTGCGGGDLDVVRLARRGRVQTFVVNQTMPPPFQAPLPMVVVDLDDGARIMVQGSSDDATDLAIDDTVTLSLRLYATERGIPVYGYKAFRVVADTLSATTSESTGARVSVPGAATGPGGGR